MKKCIIGIATLVSTLSACSIQETDSLRMSKEVSFYAVNGDASETKTVLQEDGKIWWSPQDEINIFCGESGNYKFTSTNTSASVNVEFKGSLKNETGKNEYWAVYPYSSDNTFDGSSFGVTLPSEQYAVAGSFKDDLFISVAKTTDNNLVFYNVCGGVKFTVTQPGVTSVVFKGINNETLAGTASVSFDSYGKPYIKIVSDAKTQITVTLESGAPFAVGTWYYIVTFPATLLSGYSMTLKLADGKQSVKTGSNPVTIKRSIWGVLKDVDSSSESNTPEAVDLGLSVKWASCNLGASKPEDYGNYYAWGETETKNDFSWSNYKWSSGSNQSLTKYNTNPDYGIVDNKVALDLEDDVAHIVLGEAWRMPTYTEIEELIHECIWEVTTINGVQGERVTGPNGNSIFLPDSNNENKNGTFWSSTGQDGLGGTLWYLSLDISFVHMRGHGESESFEGNVIRPVYKEYVPISSISLDQSYVPLKNGYSKQLTAIVLPEDATHRTVTWTSSDTTVATVGQTGTVVSKKAGTTIITAYSADGSKSSTCNVTVFDPISEPDAIDMGLSVKWASSNLGAYYIEDIGESYAWGNIEPFNGYQYEDQFNPSGDKTTYTKYTGNDYDTLQLEDDAAHVILGKDWRMPTIDEWKELMNKDNCNWTWETMNGQNGYIVSSKITGNSIFLPDRNSRIQLSYLPTSFYWSSSLYLKNPSNAFSFNFSNDTRHIAATYVRFSEERRYYGFMIRPVYGEYVADIPVTGVSLNTTSIELEEGESFTLVATVEPADATDKTVNWSSTDETIASVNQDGLVNAHKEGTITIIAKAGNKEASCAVTVKHDSSNDPIIFADAIAKYACVEKFDANKDGEVSYAEAAAVTSLSGLFTNWDTVTSFEEIKFFTGVTSTDGVFSNLKYLESITIPDNITRMGDFSGCISLEKVILPQNLTSLPPKCFFNCSSLKNVILPLSITALPNNCFQYCSAIESIELPESVVSIGDYAFSSCHLLSNINIPTGLCSIGQRSFEDCPGISSVIFPESLTQLGVYSFDGCTSLATVAFHGPMTAIPEGVFNGCKSLSIVTWPENLISIGDYAFFSCPLTDGSGHSVISIPESVASIGRCCFSLIQHILLPSKQYVSISDSAFSFGTVLYVPQDLIEPYRQRTNWRNYIPFIYDTSSYPVDINVHDFVDLGLSVQWARCDLGSSRPEQAGTAYQWYYNDIVPDLTNNISRTPTRAECQELIDNCQWTSGWMFGIQGVLITCGKEGLEHNWLFLPAGGATGINVYSERCYYWCLDEEQENGRHSVLYYDPYSVQQVKDITTVRAGTVCPIRPVKK